MILQCKPLGLCSWDFMISGGGINAVASFNWLGESGQFTLNGRVFTVSKKGILSPQWNLSSEGRELAVARKQSLLSRAKRIQAGSRSAVLKPTSVFGRSMRLQGRGLNASIKPKHMFTKRAQISGEWDDEVLLIFGFWLSVLNWRRSARNNSNSGAS